MKVAFALVVAAFFFLQMEAAYGRPPSVELQTYIAKLVRIGKLLLIGSC